MQVADAERLKDALRCGRSNCECRRGNVHCPAHEDNHPSFTVSEKNGTVLVHCQSGCSQETVIEALKSRNLWTEKEQKNLKHLSHSGPPQATWDYTDEMSNLLYETVRWPDKPDGKKDISYRRPAKTGGWVYNLNGTRRVLYHLPEVVAAAKNGKSVIVAEGEKCVDALRSIGFTATTNPHGAGNWRDEYSEYLRGSPIVILPDNDKPGQEHAEAIAFSLRNVARSIKIVSLPGLEDKEDIFDWLKAGHTRDELIVLVKEAPVWANIETPDQPTFNRTEYGDSERFVSEHGEDIRFSSETKEWFVWDGFRWLGNQDEMIIEKTKQTLRTMFQTGLSLPVGTERNEQLKHALKGEKAAHMRNMEFLARSERRVLVTRNIFDADPLLLNCKNGTVNLRSGVLKTPERADMITMSTGCEYDLEATCPLWLKFLNRILPDPAIRDFMQRACGYALTGDTTEQCFFFLHGEGANGKSTMIAALLAVMGDYGLQSVSDLLLAKKGDRVPVDIAELNKRRLVATIEIDDGRRMAEGLVKQMTGGDDMRARFLYKGLFQFTPTHKVFMAANHKPIIRGTDLAIWRRVMMVPYLETITAQEKDAKLIQKLKCEASGILNWCIDGCLSWQTIGLDAPNSVQAAIEEYRSEQDTIGQFTTECCVKESGRNVQAARLYEEYKAWCARSNEYCLTNSAFGAEMTRRGHPATRNRSGNLRMGIDLKNEALEI